MTTCNIISTLTIEGFHSWKGCDIEEVSFLQFPHRHIFHICAKKKVISDDRQIEIIQFKRQITAYLSAKYGTPCNFMGMSCEMIAREIQKQFACDYVSVLEDGENGAEIINN